MELQLDPVPLEVYVREARLVKGYDLSTTARMLCDRFKETAIAAEWIKQEYGDADEHF